MSINIYQAAILYAHDNLIKNMKHSLIPICIAVAPFRIQGSKTSIPYRTFMRQYKQMLFHE